MLDVSKPCTVYISFVGETPKLFNLYDSNGDLHYFRYLDGRTPRIKFNLPIPGSYTSDKAFNVVKIVPIEIPDMWPPIPEADRDRYRTMNIVHVPELKGTPARIYTDGPFAGRVEVSDEFIGYPKPVRTFLLLHEQGHMFYSKEEDCDLWAIINYLRLGYNRAMAYYSLHFVLRRTPENVYRLKMALNNIQKTQKEKI